MDENCPNSSKFHVNLKRTPPSLYQDSLKKTRTGLSEEVAKRRPQEGMKLVKYDEAPTGADQADTIPRQNLTAGVECLYHGEKWEFSLREERETRRNTASKNFSRDEGTSKKGSAKSHVYEICAANHWKPPLFECCKEEGPSHLKMFTFRVTLEIKQASTTVLECFGAPQRNKKAAAEHAAEGALWYLKNIGYSSKKD